MKEGINLVTGASGFLGSHLVEELIGRGEKVRVFVRRTSDLSFLKQFDIEIVLGSLSDRESVFKATEGIHTVFHCAAYVSDFGPYKLFKEANIDGVENILECSLANKVKRLIHVSTTDVYGYPRSSVDESYPFRKRGFFYGDTKIEGEKLVWEYYKKHKIPVTVFRPATIYGSRVPLFSIIFSMLRQGNWIHLGLKDVDAGLLHVSNFINAMLLARDNDDSIGEAYNIIDGNHVSFRDLTEQLSRISGYRNPRIFIIFSTAYFLGFCIEKIYRIFPLKDRPFVTRMAACLFGISQDFSIDKIKRELGWKPAISFEEAMKTTRREYEKETAD